MSSLVYNSRDLRYKTPFGAVREGTAVTLRINACGTHAFFKLRPDGGNDTFLPMEPDGDGFVATITLSEGLYWYRFLVDSREVSRFQNGEGYLSPDGDDWQLTVYSKDFETPDGFAGGIIYQIFPDRFFCSGAPKTGVPDDRFLRKSGQPEYRQGNGPCSLGNDYFGGDLSGIRQKLGYLSELGVSVIYLNPIFEAHSNHRYNTADYMKIDPLLGTENDLKALCAAAERFGISVILDGVFSHTGDDSRYFNRYKRYGDGGAYNRPDSEYFDWYKFTAWPDGYHSWWGVPSLPETDEENASFSEFITGENGVLRKWQRCGVKGWRLDVADELPDGFLDKIRTAVKSEDKNAIIIGEVWEDATNKISYGARRRYLLGRQLDSVMNYPVSNALIRFLTGGSAENFCDVLQSIYENCPRPALRLLMNHIGTHDTPRILTMLGGEPANGRDRAWQAAQRMNPGQLDYAKKLLYLAAVLQYTLPGIPSLYYGDEAGVEGYGDPFCRGFYPWGHEDFYLLDFYKRLGQFRRSCRAFIDGDFIPVFAGQGHIAYIRRGDGEEVLICVNRSHEQQRVFVGEGWETAEIIFGYLPENGQVKIDGLGFTVLKK